MAEETKAPEVEQESSIQQKPNMGMAWAVLVAVFIAGIAVAWQQNKILPVMTFIMADLNVSAAVAGMINSVGGIVGFVLAFPAAGMIRKMGVKAAGLAALILTVIGGVIGFIAPDEIALLVGRTFEGFGVGIIGVLAPAVIAMWFPIEKRAMPMGIWASWQCGVVAAVYMFTGNILGPEGDWKNMFIVGFVLMAIAIILYAIIVRAPKPGVEPNFADSTESSVSLVEVVKSPSLWAVSIAGATFGVAIGIFAGWIPSYWASTGVMDIIAANQVVGWIYLGEAIACIFAGVLLNKVKRRKRFAAIVSVLYAIVLFAAYHTTTYFGVIAVSVGYFVFEGAFACVMWALLPQTVKDPRLVAGAIAFFMMCNTFGMISGVPLAGAILDATAMTGWTYLSVIAGACLLISAVAYWFMKIYGPNGDVVE